MFPFENVNFVIEIDFVETRVGALHSLFFLEQVLPMFTAKD